MGEHSFIMVPKLTYQLDCDFLVRPDVGAVVYVTERTAAQFAAESVLASNSKFHESDS